MKKLILFITFLISFNTLYAQQQAERSLTEYRVESFQTPLVAKKMLYDWLGKWDNVLYTENNQALLVWSNRNIINEANETFTLIASSIENEEEMYGTIQVLTSKKQDALAKDSPFREYLNEYLKTISKKETKSKKFYKEYIKVVY
ncbi:hypothetical protein [Empedobacter brevis]|uniref:DUF4468 domain-containing protein n=1 Tax=Empedobacter brevis NBRC 14943 = ATCC 43319 TaxID=1218108 RepID=A0A511NLM4_9FLAO|nr:hypothetical protein [Empedobacter brevis]GEM53646.1 hypothetical protein EB1_34360 [Empedobacter brevis NBRC 14943 = ATCC 43319]